MNPYDKKRRQDKLRLYQPPKKNTNKGKDKSPIKNIPVVINNKLIVYTDDASKIEEIKRKYANR